MKKIATILFAFLLAALTVCGLAACVHEDDGEDAETEALGRVRFSIGEEVVYATVYDNSLGRDFMSRLPLTLEFSDYNGTEKIAYLPSEEEDWDLSDAPVSCTPSAGDLTVYAPWGNIAIFYRDFRHSEGLVPFGKLDDGGVDLFAAKSGDFEVLAEIVQESASEEVENPPVENIPDSPGTEESVEGARIQMTVDGNKIFVTLTDNSATRDLVRRLRQGSITLSFSDFGGSEKIAYFDEELDASDAEGCDPVVGDLTIYTPWGNLAAFYRDTSGYSSSLVLVGKIEGNGIEILASQSGTFTAVLELV